MRIGEVAEETGLSISNIRFYEKKGLLSPAREKESRYRDYNVEDVERLKQIILYRKLEISVENIALLLQGEISSEELLQQQKQRLLEREEALQASIELCDQLLMREKEEELAAEPYLAYIREKESLGTRFAQINDVLSGYADLFLGDNRFFLPFELHVGPVAGRIMRVLVTLFFLLVPFAYLIGNYMDYHTVARGSLCMFLVLVLVCWGPFLRLRMLLGRERACKLPDRK